MEAISKIVGRYRKIVLSLRLVKTSAAPGMSLPRSRVARVEYAAMAWLLADPAPSPWYAQLGAVLVLGGLAFGLIRPFVLHARQRRRNQPKPLQICWQGKPANFQPQPYHWALATALMFSVRNENAWDSLALDAPADKTRASLRQSWGISDRASLLQALSGLFTSGHREHLQALVSRAAALSPAAFEQQCEQLLASGEHSDDEKRELLWQMRAARDNLDGIQEVDFLAWDLVRFVMLCQNGVLLGYLSDAEARDFILLPSRLMQRNYRSWYDCADQFTRARGFWTGGDPAMKPTQEATRQTIALLQKDSHSPWKLIPWDTILPSPTPLFAQTLAQMNLLAPLNDYERQHASSFALLLDDGLQG